MSGIAAEIAERGFAMLPNVVDANALAAYRARLSSGSGAGVRNVFDAVPETRAFVDSAALARRLAGVIGPRARIVRAILFDKSHGVRGSSWRVPWHQDLFVAVARRPDGDVPGFSAWTTKDGVAHARAPREVLEAMLAVRIHIDDCGVDDGPLRVLPGSHIAGVVDGGAMTALALSPFACVAVAGAALVMRPLLVHASSSATSSARRRVLHLEIADRDLSPPLAWAEARPVT